MGRPGAGRSPGADHPVGCRADRARVERRRLDHVATPVGLDDVLAGTRARGGPRSRKRGGTHRSEAARVRAGHGADIEWWLASHRHGGAQGAGRRRGGRGGPRRADRPPAARRPGGTRAGRAVGRDCCPRSTRRRWAGPSATGPGTPPGGAVRQRWERRAHGAVGRIVGGWHQDDNGDVELQLLDDVGADGLRAFELEAARLAEWLGGVRVPPAPRAAVEGGRHEPVTCCTMTLDEPLQRSWVPPALRSVAARRRGGSPHRRMPRWRPARQ